MRDPTIKRASVTIKYSASDGYRSAVNYSHVGRGGMSPPLPPQAPLIEALAELARLTALFGFESEALDAFYEARARVAEFKRKRIA